MANYIEQFSKGLDWARVFQRTDSTPLDRTSMFSSYDDAVQYASGGNDSRGLSGTSYIGQIVTVYENDQVKIYKINSDRTLSSIDSQVALENIDESIDEIEDTVTSLLNTEI